MSTVDASMKRKRSPSRSASPNRERSPPARRRRSNTPPSGSNGREGYITEPRTDPRDTEMKAGQKDKPEVDPMAEFKKLTSGTRSGGVYMPPARLRALQAEAAKDKNSPEYQRLSWDALRKSITGIVNRVNITNIKQIVPELVQENLVRGKGLFARSIMKAQAASLPFTPVFAALVAIINTKLPPVGELVLTRLVSQFRRSFKRNDKTVCVATSTFIAHLVNQSVASETIALEIIILLLERPTDSSVEIAVGFMREVGAYLAEIAPKANAHAFERFRAVLHEGLIDKRVQYMIEVLFQVRKDNYKDNPILPEGLDLVEQEDQITHDMRLDDTLEVQEGLNVFKYDSNFLENEEEYKKFKAEVLGEDSDEEEDSGSEDDSEDEAVEEKEGIQDKTETNLVNLRRVIYLTIMNALSYEEAVHKLLKVKINEGEEIELCNMVIECCSQERSYSSFYGLIGERFSKLNRVWCESFEQAFTNYYETIHRYETNRLRNIARFFGHLLASDSVSWAVLEVIKMNENDTTSASRIFVKVTMQEMSESMGMSKLADRFKDPDVRQHCRSMFPTDIPKNTRFSINFFTSINLGVLTVEMREHLQNAQKLIMEERAKMEMVSSSSDSDSDSSDSLSSSSDSNSDSERRSRRRSYSPERRKSSQSPRADSRRRMNSSPPRRRSPLRGDRDYDRRRDHTPLNRRYGEKDGNRRPSLSPPPVRSRYSGRAGRSFSRSKSPSRSRSPARKVYGRDDRDRYSSRRDSPRRREDSPPRRDRYGDRDNRRDVTPPFKKRRDSVGDRGSKTPPLRARNARTPPRYRDRSRSRDQK